MGRDISFHMRISHGDAHALLAPILGSAIAPTLFGIALPCGLNSTVTAILAGRAVTLDLKLIVDFVVS